MTDPQHLTRDGIEVLPEQVWADLDKRQPGRRLTVVAVEGGRAVMRSSNSGTTTRVRISRMHRHSTGFSFVSGPTAGQGSPQAGQTTSEDATQEDR